MRRRVDEDKEPAIMINRECEFDPNTLTLLLWKVGKGDCYAGKQSVPVGLFVVIVIIIVIILSLGRWMPRGKSEACDVSKA